MWIERELEAFIAAALKTSPVLVLTGARQAGKTSLLRRTLPQYAYVNLDLPSVAEAAEEGGENFLRAHPPPALIDEVQYAPRILRYIKAAVDAQAQAGLYALTGSHKFQLMQGVSESLAGRAAIIDCHSLSAAEIERFSGQPLEGAALLQAMFSGGYPKLHATAAAPELFFASYVATYLERDVRQILQVRSLRDFNRFLTIISLRNGQLLSAQAVAAEVGVSAVTIRQWLGVLESSNIIVLMPPYFRNAGKRLVKTPKLYFLDTGLACFLAGLRSPAELQRSSLLGPMFETFVAGQIVRHFANRGRVPRLYFYRDRDGLEVDFVLALGEQLHLMKCTWHADASLKVPAFEQLRRQLGDDCILSRTVITSHRGYQRTQSGVARGDCLSFDHLDPAPWGPA